LQHQGAVNAVAFSPDGKTIATASDDTTAQLWSATTGQQLGPPLQHQGSVTAVAFSPDGKTVATGSLDRTARLWLAATGQPLGSPLKHQGLVYAVAFSKDGKTIATGSTDKTARLWSAATGQPLGPPLRHQDYVTAVTFSPDGKTIATGSGDKTARLWSTATGQPLGPLLQHQDRVEAVAFSPDGKTIATASWDKTARLWSAATGQPVGRPLQHTFPVVGVVFSPDGKTIATASQDATARIWEVPVPADVDWRRVELWTQAATGIELDRQGGIGFLDREAWEERRRQLDKMGGPPALLPSDALTVARRAAWAQAADRAWHESQVWHSIKSRQWFAALFHLKPLLKAEPRRAQLLFRRGQALAGMEKWKEAMSDIEQALAADAALADDLKAGNRYRGACYAALAASSRDPDSAPLDPEDRARWRKQAVLWLRADLALWQKRLADRAPESRAAVQQRYLQCRRNPDLAGIRDAAALAKLPAEEQAACKKLWADVAALLEKAKP
jgi:roadblock/LC7 domain-containing protein